MKVGLFSKQHNNARVESELQFPLDGVCMLWEGWEQLPRLLSSEMELEHEAVWSQEELWNTSEHSRLLLGAACGSQVLLLGTGRCCGPGGMLPTMGHLLEQGHEQGGFWGANQHPSMKIQGKAT